MKKMLKRITIILVVVSSVGCNTSSLQTKINTTNLEDSIKKNIPVSRPIVISDSDFVRLNLDSLGIIKRMAYATDSNFMGTAVYPCAECYLRARAAINLKSAQKNAMARGYRIIVFDCYRPLSIQQKMFLIVKNAKYVADPQKGSNHNRGVAVDVSLADKNGNPLDMGTPFDDFSEKAHFSSNDTTNTGKNRTLLRNLMIESGFLPYNNEWWHFHVGKKVKPLSNFVWKCQ